MTKPDTPAKKYDTEEGTPAAAYVVLVVLVVALVAVIFLNTGSKDTQAVSASFSSTQTMERMGGSTEGSSAKASSGQAAAPLTHVPPVEPLVKEKMRALETSEPSLEGSKQCYWLEKNSGAKRWVPVTAIYGTALSKYSCYELDSCDGGLAKSRGGCYKWAPSPTSQRDPW